jgi:Uma2 family endonuclease
MYEDDQEGDLGESNPHVTTDEILHVCLKAHLASRPEYQVYSNMNLHYPHRNPKVRRWPYVSPDTMVVRPFQTLDENLTSYWIGRQGPAPALTAEILSERSAQQRDLDKKVVIYARLGVAEYILVDPTGEYLPTRQRLLLKSLGADRKYEDHQDADSGVTSRLGFRLIFDSDGRLRVIDVATGKRYIRPDEAQAEADARRLAEERIRALEAELQRLRGSDPSQKGKKKRKR